MAKDEDTGISIFYRLLMAFLGVVIAVIVILTVIFFVFDKQCLKKITKERISQNFDILEHHFRDNFKGKIIKDLELLASNPTLNEFIMSSGAIRKINARALERLFLEFIHYTKSYQRIYFVDYLGKENVIVSKKGRIRKYHDISDTRLFTLLESGTRHNIKLEGPYKDKNGKISFSIGIHKVDEDIGMFGGAVIIEFNLEEFFDYLDKIKIFGENPIWVFAPNGKILKKPHNAKAIFDPSPYLLNKDQETPTLKVLNGGILIYQDLYIIPSKPFIRLAISIPSSLLLKDIGSILRFFLIVFIFSIIITSIVAFYISRYLSRPIIELAEAATCFAKGDLFSPIKIKTCKEVQILVNSINQMICDLQKTTVSKNYMDNIIKTMLNSLIVISPQGKIKTVNTAVCMLLGYKANELIGQEAEMIFDKELSFGDSGCDDAFIRKLVGNRETIYQAKDGRKIPVLFSSSIMYNGDDIQGIICVAQDITDHKKVEEKLQRSQKKLQTIIDSIPVGIFIIDTDKKIMSANRAILKLTGFESEEQVGEMICHNIFHPAEVGKCPVIDLKQKVDMSERLLITKDGRHIPILKKVVPIELNGQDVLLEAVFDITERKKMEEELQKVQKLESLGILAGGIAHDFNNLLTAIIGNLSLVELYAETGENIFEVLEKAKSASYHTKHLTQQLITFAKGGLPIKETISVANLLEDVSGFALSGSKSRYQLFIPKDLWWAELDKGQIQQTLSNLLINADQAMPDGGIIEVIAMNLIVKEEDGLPLYPGRYIKISVKDQGVGIPRENIQKVFDPYFTTKSKGSGLGLAITYSIIKKHGGYISVKSEVEVGTTFTVYLPAVEKEIFSVKDVVEEKIYSGKGHILLMDDQQEVWEVAKEMLTHLEYKVQVVKDGAEAIELYKKAKYSGQPFDAVILDLTIPGGMSGKDAIKKILEINPEAKAIVSSGYSNDPIISDYKVYGFRGIIKKPYVIEELSKVLHEVITEPEK